MEYIDCVLCGIDETKILFKKKDKFGIVDDEFYVVKCKQCGLLYINPRPTPEEMSLFYPETYSWRETLYAHSSYAKLIRRMEKIYRYHLLRDEVSKVVRFTGKCAGKVLDVGCGTGDRLDVFRMRGFETYGVEISNSVDYAKGKLRLNVLKGDIFSGNFPNEFFDIVTLYHVLEHTHHPIQVCGEIYRILKEDGFLIVQVPNKDSFQSGIFKQRWAAFDVPRDLYYFGIETLQSVLKKTGFTLIRIDHFMNWWHPPTLVSSLFPKIEPQKAWKGEKEGKTTLLNRIGWVFLTLLSTPLAYLESALKHGAILTYYAVKNKRIQK